MNTSEAMPESSQYAGSMMPSGKSNFNGGNEGLATETASSLNLGGK